MQETLETTWEMSQKLKTLAHKIIQTKDTDEREKIKQEYNVLKEKLRIEQEKEIIEWFKVMEPFNGNVDKIPSIPKVDKEVYDSVIIPNLIRCGAIPKKDLIVGKTYLGDCRNASEAVWNGKTFTYQRYKCGFTYPEDINHFEDDDGYDLFVPIKEKSE